MTRLKLGVSAAARVLRDAPRKNDVELIERCAEHAAALNNAKSREKLQADKGTKTLVSSSALLEELAEVIQRAKFRHILLRTNTSLATALAEVRRLAEVMNPPPLAQRVCRDPDDDQVLALAVAARADLIVSGDRDLLSLGTFDGIPIVAPR